MEKEEIQKQIDNAVRIFRETLEKTYLRDNKEFYGIGTHSFQGILTGKIQVRRLANENLKISGELGKACINPDCKGLPMKFNDWAIYPLVITLFNKDVGEKELSKKENKPAVKI